MAHHPIRLESLATLWWEPQISTCSLFVAYSTSLLTQLLRWRQPLLLQQGALRTKELQQAWKTDEEMIPQKTTTISLKAEETRNIKAREFKKRTCYTTCLLHQNMRMELSRCWVIQLDKSKLCKMAWRVNHWWITKWDSLQSELKSIDDIFCAKSFSLVSF